MSLSSITMFVRTDVYLYWIIYTLLIARWVSAKMV